MSTTYRIDRAMLGAEDFHGSIERVAELLREQGYDVEAVTDSYNGADNEHYDGPVIPERVFWEAGLAREEEGCRPVCPVTGWLNDRASDATPPEGDVAWEVKDAATRRSATG